MNPEQQQYPYAGPPTAPYRPVPAPRRTRRWPWIVLGVLGFLFVVGIVSGGHSSAPASRVGPTVTYAAPALTLAPVADPAPVAGPATSIGDGTYEVGTDVAAGRYKTAGPPADAFFKNCYWSRNKNDSGEFESIIANDNVQGPGSVTIRKGEFFTATGGCTWSKA